MTTPESTSAVPTTAPRFMLPLICAAAFLVFTQTFMIAPLIPRLAGALGSTVGWVALAVPAYVVPQALATLVSGPLSDRLGRRRVILGSLAAFVVVVALTASVKHIAPFIGWRIAAGLVAAGIVPICLTLIGDVVPYAQRGRAVGWLFGSIAGGTATGAALGALLEPLIGWRALFLLVAALSALVMILILIGRVLPRQGRDRKPFAWRVLAHDYAHLLRGHRAQRTYAYVLINAVLQSGVFTWLAVYLHQKFGLDEWQIGLTLLGYGIPGLLFGPVIGRLADRMGRARIIPTGIGLTGLCALAFTLPLSLNDMRVVIILLSLGFDLTQPLLAAIATDLGGGRGQAVAVMACCLFGGFGLGSLLFQAALGLGFAGAFMIFGIAGLIAAIIAVPLFRSERPKARKLTRPHGHAAA